jgi:hypothetical protein
MPRSVTIRSLPRAFDLVEGMQAQGLEWGEGYRGLGRVAIALILGGQMDQVIDEHLARMSALDQADRRNCPYRQHSLTELGETELAVPRTRRFAPIAVVRAYARHAERLDRMILACFVLGLSVRKSLPSRKRWSARRCCQSWDGRSPRRRSARSRSSSTRWSRASMPARSSNGLSDL